jgi:hypothetical protein
LPGPIGPRGPAGEGEGITDNKKLWLLPLVATIFTK